MAKKAAGGRSPRGANLKKARLSKAALRDLEARGDVRGAREKLNSRTNSAADY